MASAISTARSHAGAGNGLLSPRLARFNTLLVCLFHAFAPVVKAFPVFQRSLDALKGDDLPKDPDDASLWVYLGTAIALVLLGGAFAGLTIAYVPCPTPIHPRCANTTQPDGPG